MLSKFSRLLIPLLLALASSAHAQTNLSVRGFVTDSTGATVPGATIRLETAEGQLIADTKADQDGMFALLRLAPGDFSLVVPAYSGFAIHAMPLHLMGSVTNLHIKLSLESVSQEVTVGGEQALSTDSSANRGTISMSGESLRKLPVFDQDPIATLTPFLDASSGSSGGVTLIVDGIEMKGLGVSATAIQEVRINNDPYSAEYTRPGRGRIEVTTKPGSSQFHGEANFIFRDSIFNAKNHFALTRPPETRRIYEGHLTGPIGNAGRTSFAASGSYREQNTAAIVSAVGPSADQPKRSHSEPQLTGFSPDHARLLAQSSSRCGLQLPAKHEYQCGRRRDYPRGGRI